MSGGYPEEFGSIPTDFDDIDSLSTAQVATSGSATSGWDEAAVSALGNAKLLVDYFDEVHGYRAINESGKDNDIIVNVIGSNAFAS